MSNNIIGFPKTIDQLMGDLIGCEVCGAKVCTSKGLVANHSINPEKGPTSIQLCINCAIAHVQDLVQMMESLALKAQDQGFMS